MGNNTSELNDGFFLNQRYKIDCVLGRGGFGITYRAYDIAEQKKCAVKELFPSNICARAADRMTVLPISNEKAASFMRCKERFFEEAYSLQELRHIPSVVDVYDCFEENGTCYFVMEYLDGLTLSNALEKMKRPFTWEELSPVIVQIARSLSAVHSNGFFHRDITPKNIILLPDLTTKLIDFGNAKVLADVDNVGLSVFLTPGFAPIEQYSKESPQGTYTDVYALAATLYYLLTEKKIPVAPDRIMSNTPYQNLAEFGISRSVSDAFDRALANKYKERTQTVDAFLEELGLSGSVSRERRIQLCLNLTGKSMTCVIPSNVIQLIGRDQVCDIQIPETIRIISGKHLEVLFDDETETIQVRDVSRYGTFRMEMRTRLVKEEITDIDVTDVLYLAKPENQLSFKLLQ